MYSSLRVLFLLYFVQQWKSLYTHLSHHLYKSVVPAFYHIISICHCSFTHILYLIWVLWRMYLSHITLSVLAPSTFVFSHIPHLIWVLRWMCMSSLLCEATNWAMFRVQRVNIITNKNRYMTTKCYWYIWLFGASEI